MALFILNPLHSRRLYMLEILKGAGVFVYPLMLCSLVGGFIIFERLFALRVAIIPAQ